MELANFIVEAVLKQAVTDKIVVYGGRFQPFHKGHKKVYDALVSKFGSKNVYIATSDVQDGDKSPLSFNDKKEIATKLFGIPSSKFVKVKQPYQPVEILRGYDDTTTALIVAVGEKDDSRLGGNYFKPYTNDKNLKGYAVNAYVYSALPSNSFGATDVRNMFRNNRMGGERKQKEFEKFFGKFDKAIYTKLITKLNEGVDTDNNIPGGKADDLTLVDIAKKWAGDYYDYKNVLDTVKQELKRGIKIELEHTSDIKIAAEIAKDHLAEKLTYYRDLHNIEKGMYQPHNPIKEASAAGSGYDEKTLDQLVDNPDTGEKVKVRSALNYDKNHPSYRAAMALVGKSGAQSQPPANRNAGGPMTGANNKVGAKPTPGANNQNGTNSTNKTQKPLDKPLTNPAQAQEKPQQPQPQQKKPAPMNQTAPVDDKGNVAGTSIKVKPTLDEIPPKFKEEVNTKITGLAKHFDEDKKQATEKVLQRRGLKSKDEVKPEEMEDFKKEVDSKREPTYNLCDISVPGTNLYCNGNKGIPRKKMPQFKGKPQPGSQAEKDLEAEKKAGKAKPDAEEINGEKLYAKMLEDKGIKVTNTEVPAESLKATQTELVGDKVLGMEAGLEADPTNPNLTAPLYVSKDGYVIDGHHRWAAITSYNIKHPEAPIPLKVMIVDQDIDTAIQSANDFANEYGVATKSGQEVGPGSDTNKETPASGVQPTKGSTDAKSAGIGKVATKAVQNPKVLARTIKHNISKWSDKEKQFFRGNQHKANSPARRSIGEAISNKVKSIVPSVKKEMAHLGHTFQHAGEGISNLFQGKPISDKEKDAFKTLGKTIAMSAVGVALGGGLGHGVGMLMKHLGGHLAEHLVAEIAIGGIGKAAIFAGTELDGDNDKYVEWFTLYFAKEMKEGKIPLEVWDSAVQDYNRDKEDGKLDGDTNTVAEVITEMSTNDVHFKHIMKHYKTSKFAKRINMYLFGKPNIPNSSSNVARELRNMNYDEITQMEKELNITDMDEDINVKVDKGDVVLTGKFKNKKTVVKDISKDQHGMPTINGRQATTFRKVEEGIINEGGAYGHMNHPFDVRMNLSFGDLKAIVNNALDGNLGVVREKTDGQALAISWKNGRLISARNKGHLANAGANAMDINGVATKFGGRGGLTDAYNFAMKDLENAIRGLSQAQKDKIFKEGKVFVNLEVIWPTSVNVIPYNQALLVFHNAVEYNEAGNPIGKVDGAESVLGGMLKQINAHVQSKYTIQGPPIVKLPKTKELSSQKGKFKGMISKLQSEFGLTDKDGVADYHQAWWENFIVNSKKKISALEKAGLVKRWAFDDKSMRVGDIKDDKARAWADGIDKGPKTTIMSGNLRKFEDIFLGVGAEVLSFMSSVLTAQPDKALQSMRAELESSANQIMNGGTITQIKKLEKELSRLNAIGGFEKIVPSEGIVFSYKGNAYKLTGAFAPLNQILGIFKFSR